MLRRVHLSKISVGSIALPPEEAHHIRDVLRLTEGETLELFDDAGCTASAVIKHVNQANVVVEVQSIETTAITCKVAVAAAIPKGDRADWLVEKLSELGVWKWIPLAAERSVTLPGGKNKIERWERIAIEAAKQSRRPGTMAISPVTSLAGLIATKPQGWYLSTADGAIPAKRAVTGSDMNELLLLIGPEGGWSDAEISQMNAVGLIAVALTSTILRVETAAVVAAALVLCHQP